MIQAEKIRSIVYQERRFAETLNILDSELADGAQVLEVGSNEGSFNAHLNRPNWRTVDKYGTPDITADLTAENLRLPLDDNSLDAAICTEVLEHLIVGKFLMAEFHRVLKPTGALYISVPNMVSLACRMRWIVGELPANAASGDCGRDLNGTGNKINGVWLGGHVCDFNPKRLASYLERANFHVAEHYRSATTVRKILIPTLFTTKNLADYVIMRATPR